MDKENIKKCLIIYNPNSGKGTVSKYLEDVKQLIFKKNYEIVDIIATKGRGDATDIVENYPYVDLVMSFGGDGTFNEIINGNFKRKEQLLLTHIPVGTTNDIGTMFGYTKDIIKNVKMSLEGVEKEIDIPQINNRSFIYVAGFGKYTNISYDTPREIKKIIGHLAYVKEGVIAFFSKTKLYNIDYKINGKDYHGLFSLVLISNANHIGGINNLYKDIKLNDNLLEVMFCTFPTRKAIVKAFCLLKMYGPEKVPGLYFYRTNKIEMTINDDHKPFCIDGEKLSSKPLEKYTIEIPGNRPRARILVPKKNAKKLFD